MSFPLEWKESKIELPPHACDNCGGEGQEQGLDAREPEGVYAKTCPQCGGSGYMISWDKLCKDSHKIAESKGWLETPRSFAGDIGLMHSELSEALEEYRNHKGLNEVYYEIKVETGGVSYSETVSTLKEGAHGKPCGIPIELADYIIRICQFSGSNGVNIAQEMHFNLLPDEDKIPKDFEELIADLHKRTSDTYGAYRDGKGGAGGYTFTAVGFAGALQLLMRFCKDHSIEIEEAVFKKQVYNETRPHRHGGKKI